MLNKSFDILIEEDKETKQYYGSVPNLPGCYSTGDTVEELITNMKEAISLYLEVKKEEKSIVFENITHDVVIAALFQRLSGEKYHSQFKDLPKDLESLRIDITKEGKATMQFRNYKKGITETLKEI